MQFYGFIFLARKWEQDKPRFRYRLSKLAAGGKQEPMWLMIFPEGTNLSDNGRKASAKYAEKTGIKDLRHLMIPRSTGLRFCLENLAGSVDWVYDCTVAYEGIPYVFPTPSCAIFLEDDLPPNSGCELPVVVNLAKTISHYPQHTSRVARQNL